MTTICRYTEIFFILSLFAAPYAVGAENFYHNQRNQAKYLP